MGFKCMSFLKHIISALLGSTENAWFIKTIINTSQVQFSQITELWLNHFNCFFFFQCQTHLLL